MVAPTHPTLKIITNTTREVDPQTEGVRTTFHPLESVTVESKIVQLTSKLHERGQPWGLWEHIPINIDVGQLARAFAVAVEVWLLRG